MGEDEDTGEDKDEKDYGTGITAEGEPPLSSGHIEEVAEDGAEWTG
jgi:hypothetical protein